MKTTIKSGCIDWKSQTSRNITLTSKILAKKTKQAPGPADKESDTDRAATQHGQGGQVVLEQVGEASCALEEGLKDSRLHGCYIVATRNSYLSDETHSKAHRKTRRR